MSDLSEIEYKLLLLEANKDEIFSDNYRKIRQAYFDLNAIDCMLLIVKESVKLIFAMKDNEEQNVFVIINVSENYKSVLKKIFNIKHIDYDAYYPPQNDRLSIRIRETIINNDYGFELTIKKELKTDGNIPERLELNIGLDDKSANKLFKMAGGRIIEKTRYLWPIENELTWEVDVFAGELDGIIVAEIEVPSSDVPMPKVKKSWLYTDESNNRLLTNHSLAFSKNEEFRKITKCILK